MPPSGRPALLPISVVLACLGLPACGTNLLVERRELSFVTQDGVQHAATVELREPDGILQDDESPIRTAVLGLIAEPFDILLSTAIATDALFSSQSSVEAGPLGWLAAMTPFATLMPAIHVPPAARIEVDAAQFEALRSADQARRLEAARAACSEPRLVDARLHDTTAR
ncbi:MAG: hypothetical protein IT457_23550 [Planctomycetes bacterium]|nr:hypothetical protein [Planctomycetota bacterium]